MPSNTYTPCIILPGIGQSKVELTDTHGNKIKMAWPIDIDTDLLVNELKMPLIKSVILRRNSGFTVKLKKALSAACDPIAVNKNGTMKNTVRVVKYKQSLKNCSSDEKRYIYKMVPLQRLAEIIGEENLYFFAYNSFGEPYETAAELDSFIQQVKAETGSNKVNLVPVSMGGALSTAYFDAYGSKNDIKRVMYYVAALEGSRLIADIMSYNILPQNGLALIEMLLNKKTAEQLKKLIKILPNGLPEKMLYAAIEAIIDTVLKHSPSIWSVVPPEKYEELRNKYISGSEYTELRAKTDRFFAAQSRVREIIDEQQNNGTEFFAAVGYGLQLMPLAGSNKLSSDTIINSSSTSLGAKFADLGQKLTYTDSAEKRCTDKTHNHISPDGSLDASYGWFPERTWYFYRQVHDDIAYNDTALEIAKRVLSDAGFNDIYSDESLPQFNLAQDNRKKN